MTRKLPREVHNALAKAQGDLEWAVRMFHESTTPEAVNVPKLVSSIEAALLAGYDAALRTAGEGK